MRDLVKVRTVLLISIEIVLVAILATIVYISIGSSCTKAKYDLSVLGEDKVIYRKYCLGFTTQYGVNQVKCFIEVDLTKELLDDKVSKVIVVPNGENVNNDIVLQLMKERWYLDEIDPTRSYYAYVYILTTSNYAVLCGSTLTITSF